MQRESLWVCFDLPAARGWGHPRQQGSDWEHPSCRAGHGADPAAGKSQPQSAAVPSRPSAAKPPRAPRGAAGAPLSAPRSQLPARRAEPLTAGSARAAGGLPAGGGSPRGGQAERRGGQQPSRAEARRQHGEDGEGSAERRDPLSQRDPLPRRERPRSRSGPARLHPAGPLQPRPEARRGGAATSKGGRGPPKSHPAHLMHLEHRNVDVKVKSRFKKHPRWFSFMTRHKVDSVS